MEQPLKKQQQQQQMEGSQPQPQKSKRKLPSPRELVAHYESQGMDTQEASLKAIQDLQNVLFRMVTSSTRNKNSKDDSFKKLDVINSRLLSIDMKLDSKPGYPQTLAIGVASGALLQGAGTALPRVAAAVSQIWNSVSRASNNASSSIDR